MWLPQLKFNLVTGTVLLLLILAGLAGCNTTKNLGPHEYLLVENKIKVSAKNITADDLAPYLQQQPNSKLFGLFPANITFYNWGIKGKDSKFKRWLRTKVGSAPVVLDTSMTTAAIKQMTLFLNNKGYFNSKITDTVVLKKKKARVHYRVTTKTPYSVRRITYTIFDTLVASYVFNDSSKCLIRTGRHYDSYKIDEERSRITNHLLNQGFFRFNNTYIVFHIDSTLQQHLMDINIEITNPLVPSLDNFGAMVASRHKRYVVNKIYIYPEFDHLKADTNRYDTLVKRYINPVKGKPDNVYYFLYKDKLRIKPRTISQAVFITPQTTYNLTDVNLTYTQISGLGVYNYINLKFFESLDKPALQNQPKDLIDCRLELARSPANSFSVTTDGTNSGGAFGIQGNLSYQNRNIFRGAQLLRLSLNGSIQAQAGGGSDDGSSTFFNTIEFGMNVSLTFPQFLIPMKPERLSKSFKPRTIISAGYNFQHQTDYDRHISNLTFGYSWVQNEKIKHELNPAEVTLVKVFPTPDFTAYLDTLEDKRLKNQYTDHLVAGLRYSFTYNSQVLGSLNNILYIRANFETGGNLIYAADEIFKIPRSDSGYYTLFGLPYAQYVRPDFDIRFYNKWRKNHSMVYRFYGGIGIPYGNSNVIPFEKAFFAGGANDLRGWKMYYLGPGTYHSDSAAGTYGQVGDIKLEINLEYRFPLYKMFRGAVYLDAGNIWLLRDSPDLPGGQFNWSTFLSQVAINAGVGLRLDFDFFIFRLDPAIPLRVPWYPADDRWYFNKMQLKDIVWNFGIGYPF